MIVGTTGRAHLLDLILGATDIPIALIALGSGTRAEDHNPTLETQYSSDGLAPATGTVSLVSPNLYEVRATFTPTATLTITEYGLLAADGTPIARGLLPSPVEVAAGDPFDVAPRVAVGAGIPAAGVNHLARLCLGQEADPIAWLVLGSGTRAEDADPALETPYTAQGLQPVPVALTALDAGGYELRHRFTARDTAEALSVTEWGLVAADGTPLVRHLFSDPPAPKAGESFEFAPRPIVAPGDLVRTNLIREYRFDETGGTTLYDHSGYGQHGTKGAGAAAPNGTNGYYWYFDGGDEVTIPDVVLTGAYTIIVYAARVGTTGVDIAVGRDSEGTNKIGFNTGVSTELFICAISGGSSDTPTVADTTTGAIYAIVRGTDYKVDLSVNGGAFARLFSNVAQGSAAVPVIWNRIGTDDGASPLTGVVVDLLFYDRALTLAEIVQNANYLHALVGGPMV